MIEGNGEEEEGEEEGDEEGRGGKGKQRAIGRCRCGGNCVFEERVMR